jgi:CheY-like chemotaxis protein
MMGGELSVDSTPGVGSRFSFELTFKTTEVPLDAPLYTLKEAIKKPSFAGEVLVCEDNNMNQKVICEHLARVGLNAVVAGNGKEGVEAVRGRMLDGKKPFDLILMDIHMPVMDGFEASSKILALETETPIVVMTANVMTNDRALYTKSGMRDYIGKPFTSQELWSCLLRYFKPLDDSAGSAGDEFARRQDDAELQKQLTAMFVKDNQVKYDEIATAINSGDVKLAHRLAHTLKSNAGMIGMPRLQEAAATVESLLKNGEVQAAGEHMNFLRKELSSVLEELKPLLDTPEAATHTPNKEQALALLGQLEHMLKNSNPECANLLDEIRAVPGAEVLAKQIEEYDFLHAIITLTELKNKWM